MFSFCFSIICFTILSSFILPQVPPTSVPVIVREYRREYLLI